MQSLSNRKRFVTDKMPHNFLYIPFILAALPEAKIIHVKRDAAATCWSNFKHYFTSSGLGYSNDLKDIVTYYHMYSEISNLWEKKYKNRITVCNYDKLTVSNLVETKNLITALGLPWEEGCMSSHNSSRSIKTASQQQVRKKIYKNSSKEWFKFEPFIGNIFSSLIESR